MAKKKQKRVEERLRTNEEMLLDAYFAEFEGKCLLPKPEKKKMREDITRAISDLCEMGVPLTEALSRLSADNLGGFYSRSSAMWYSLDNAAKIYPISMKKGSMAVFRLSAYMKNDVVPSLLQMALSFTVRRFPSFATTLKKGFFWHYLNTSKTRYAVLEEKSVPCSPISVSRSNSHTFRVLYYKNRISVEFFHVLTDGMGGMEFLKTLISEYLRLLGKDIDLRGRGYSLKEAPSKEEFENGFEIVPNAKKASGFVDKRSVQMSGKMASARPARVIHLKMDTEKLLEVSKKYSATVTAYLLSVMFLAFKMSCEEMTGEASIQLPVNMRKYVPTRTLRNFSMYCGIRLPIESITTKEDMIPLIKKQMEEKTSFEEMQKMTTATKRLVGPLRLVPLFVKQPLVRLVYAFLGDRLFSTTFSNLGVQSLPPEMAEEIESLDFVLGPSDINGAMCTLITLGNKSTFTVTKSTVDPSFENEIFRILKEDGIDAAAEGSEIYGN